jgi:thiamine-phosphate pyrophosphorylase
VIGVYVIVDPEACVDPETRRPREPREVATSALRGGATRLQLRSKVLPDRDRLALARDLARLCRSAAVPFVMNDRVDLALLAGADEVHLGQDDLSIEDARRIAERLPIGRSTHDLVQVRAAREQGVDRIAFGPIFPTRSKANPDPVVGLGLLLEAISLAERPVVAIGGIDLARCAELVRAKARLSEVAVISAVCTAPDPEAATARLREALA